MKLKYVLFGGLLLSVGFTACTNEDFTEAMGPVSTSEGIALGEVTIKVGNGADTKAVLNESYVPTWEEGDLLGAARVHEIDEYDATKGVEASSPVGSASTYGGFYSNSSMELIEGEGTNDGTFRTVDPTGLTAGAHVLYYPHNKAITQTQVAALPVEIQSYDIDCDEPLKNVSDNMFAYSPVKFVPEVNKTNEFTLSQVPVLYTLYFTPSFVHTNDLTHNVTITNIVIEAWKKTATGPVSVLTKKGQVVTKNEPSNNDYNNNTLGNIVKYTVDTEGATDHLYYNVANSDNEDYQLITKTERTKKGFVFSALPWSEAADSVIVKVVTADGNFMKTYDVANAADKKFLDAFNKAKTATERGGAVAEGGQVTINVSLNTVSPDVVIYTADQMKAALDYIKDGDEYTFILGEKLDLSDYDFVLDENTEAKITFERYPLTLGSIRIDNGELTMKNEVTVKGDVRITSNTKKFVNNGGHLTVGGKLTIGNGRGSDVNITLAKAGDIQVNASGIATINGVPANTVPSVEEATTVGNINNEGQLTLKTIAITEDKTLTITENGQLYLGDNFVTNNGTIVNDGLFDMNNFDFTNNGQFDINSNFSGRNGEFANEAGAELNINCNLTTGSSGSRVFITNEAATGEAEAAVINVAKEATLTINQSQPIENDGIINVYGKIVEGNTALKQDADAARINVFDEATLQLNSAATGVKGGYIMPTQFAEVTNGTNAPVAATVTAGSNLNTLNPDINTYIMNGNFTFDATEGPKYYAKNLVFTGGTITIAENYTMGMAGNVVFEGNTTLRNGASTLSSTTQVATLKLNGNQNYVKEGKLTVGNKVKLDLTTNNAQMFVLQSNGASVGKAQQTEDAAGNTIAAGQILGERTNHLVNVN